MDFEEVGDKGVLGASFFFKRGEGDRGKAARFFTTIAAQLIYKHPHLAQRVGNAIEDDRSIADKALQGQFEKLILQPLKEVEVDPKTAKTIVVVFDALDECDGEEDVRVLIHLLSQATSLTSVHLRFFITSRPELPIRLGFKKIYGRYQDLILHEIPELIIEHDISAFLEFRLEEIRIDYNDSVTADRHLPLDRPGQTMVRKLVEMAVPLFIFAATACRFISDRKLSPPHRQLTKILKYQTEEMTKLDVTYSPVLDQLLIDLTKPAKDRNPCLQTIDHGDFVNSVAFSGDGGRLASGSYDKTVKIWDAATGALQHTLEGHGGSVTSVAFSGDGGRLASGSDDKTVKIWDAATGAL